MITKPNSPAHSPSSGPVDVSVRARPPSPRRLSRRALLIGAGSVGAIIVFAIVAGLTTPPPPSGQRQQADAATSPPESIAQASPDYDATGFVRAPPSPNPEATSELAPPLDPAWSNGAPPAPAPAHPSASPPQADPADLARSSPILFAAARARGAGGEGGVHASADDSAENRAGDQLHDALTPPRSPYEIEAGAVIPAALLTGLNSDAPGRVIAQVTEPVFDSVTGAHLLIPQGARLIGAYDNNVHYGEARIVLVWNRLILPNGYSIDLGNMIGADPSGAAGVKDAVDNHLGRLGGAVGLSAIISVIANNSENNRHTQSLSQSVGEAGAQQAAQTGSQIVERELAVRPTLRVRPGANVRVMVTRDIALRPYGDR